MLRAPHPTWLRRVAILACATSMVALGACYPMSPAAREPVTAPQRFPGVALVPTRHGGFLVRILSGLVGDGEPLYIIDGNPMMIDPRQGIGWFKPEDILRISVLKRPSDLAVYGTRGANGVILITTRQGATPR